MTDTTTNKTPFLRSSTTKKSISKLVDERIQAASKPLADKYTAERDPKNRLRIQYDIAKKAARSAVREIASLSEKDWQKYLREQTKPFAESINTTSRDILDQKLKHGQLGLQDIDLLYAEQDILQRFNLLTKADEKLLSKRRAMDRFLVLLFFQYIGLMNVQRALDLELEPFQQLNAIVHRRFGAQYYWSLAVALLATHENLVKKKLVELGMNEEEIERISRTKGFPKLIQQLARLIERKDKRSVSLAFYKTSSLRTVRNQLEHQGYKLAVTRDEIFDLLKDTLRFETELFPNPPQIPLK